MSQIKERPILFSAPMVRAIFEGRKTVTRRAIKPQPHIDASGNFCVGRSNYGQDLDGKPVTKHFIKGCCPYGQPGDRLWVRETFNTSNDCRPPIDEPFIYAADLNSDGVQKWAARWKPSIHMPRRASRILLEITGVRVERLQDISYEQARAEGVRNDREIESGEVEGTILSSKALFENLWCMINGDESWDENPWVWVVEFKRVTP